MKVLHKFLILFCVIAFCTACLQNQSNKTNTATELTSPKKDSFRKRKEPTKEEIAQMTRAYELRMHSAAGRVMDKVIFTNVQLVDLTTGKVQANMAIVVADEKIKAITATNALSTEQLKDASMYDAKDAFALPSLIDTHVHYTQAYSEKSFGKKSSALLKRKIYSGITTIRDMWGDGRVAAEFARKTYMNEIPAPDFYYAALMAGTAFFKDFGDENFVAGYGTKNGQVAWAQEITEDTNIPLAVARAKGTGATGIKLYQALSAPLVKKIIAEAKKQGILVWSHSQLFPSTPYDVLDGTTVSHTGEVVRYVVAKNKKVWSALDPPNYDDPGDMLSHPLFKKYIREAKASGILFEPTLALHPTIEEGKKRRNSPFRGLNPPRELAGKVIHAIHQNGIKLIAGSDKFAKDKEQFPMLYQELESLVSYAKLTPREALIAATSNAALSIGKSKEIGSLEKGKYANLILLKKNPIDNLSHLKTIILTVKRGKQFPRSAYVHDLK